ncbi:MAG: hypothetical protein AB7O62_11590 [Pirellulales bacterium]
MKRTLSLCIVLGLLVSVAQAQQSGRGGRGFGRGGVTGILQIEKVQEELKLKNGQKRRINELAEQLRSEMQGSFSFQSLRGVSDEQRRLIMDDFRQKFGELQSKALGQIKEILDDDQMDRFSELRLQQTGIRALAQADVSERLNLTPAQKAKVTKIMTESMQSEQTSRGNFNRQNFQQMSEQERKAAFEEMRKRGEDRRKRSEQTNEELENVLTESQKAEWEEMQGDKFEFPQRGGRGGRGQGGGRNNT